MSCHMQVLIQLKTYVFIAVKRLNGLAGLVTPDGG